MIEHLRAFLLELGLGFAFVGSEYHLEVGGQDSDLDLLFDHLRLRCFAAIDLKIAEFEPEYAGKMNFYLSALDGRCAASTTSLRSARSCAAPRIAPLWTMRCAT